MKTLLRTLGCVALLASLSSTVVAENSAPLTPVVQALLRRDAAPQLSELKKIAGSEDQLVSELLALRTRNDLPFVGIRAQKLLIAFSERSDVQAAFRSDIETMGRGGLAKVLLLHIDRVGSGAFRHELAQKAVSRADRDETFRDSLRALLRSNDPSVRELAQSALRPR